MLNNNQRINVFVQCKDLNFMQILVNENDLVYETIKKHYNGENDILAVSQDQVCYFDESFSQFKNRISQMEDLFIVVKSLKETYNKLIDFQSQYQELLDACQLVQDQYRKDIKNFEESQMKEQKQKFEMISSDGIQTTFDSRIFEQETHNKSMESLLRIVTELKKPQLKQSLVFPNQNLCESEIHYDKEVISQVTSLIDTCSFCNNPTDEKIIQLTCYHKFHEDCLISLFFCQLSNQNRVLSCLCLQKQSAPILQHIKDQNSQILLRHKLLENQLNAIIQNDKLEKCQKPACYFYFKRNNQLQQKSYCPLCLS